MYITKMSYHSSKSSVLEVQETSNEAHIKPFCLDACKCEDRWLDRVWCSACSKVRSAVVIAKVPFR